jgi:hypothetical protein
MPYDYYSGSNAEAHPFTAAYYPICSWEAGCWSDRAVAVKA